ncbi:MAG: hypothetical protein GTO02_03735, partial [Candidatus Dadabacteria bacterium]|nr:hypothetical protein [Candidatus Dadabacteria bacterium]
MSLIFLYFFGKAIQGSFVFQKLKKEENPAYKTNTKWTYIVATPLILIIVVALSLTLLTYTSVLPSLKVQSVNEISNTDINILIDNGIITKDEKVEYFYSQGFSSI